MRIEVTYQQTGPNDYNRSMETLECDHWEDTENCILLIDKRGITTHIISLHNVRSIKIIK